MCAVAKAHQDQKLAEFEEALRDYRDGELEDRRLFENLPHSSAEIPSDPTIRSHLTALYDTLLEQNLPRIVEPYSIVEIELQSRRWNRLGRWLILCTLRSGRVPLTNPPFFQTVKIA